MKAKDEDTLDSVSRHIVGDVRETRRSEHSTGGIDSAVDGFAKLPRLLLIIVFRIIRWLDFWGLMPKALTEGDTNYSTVLVSNLGSIKCPAVITISTTTARTASWSRWARCTRKSCSCPTARVRCATSSISARRWMSVADGFYFARSLKLIKYVFEHPELLDRPLSEPSGFEYK